MTNQELIEQYKRCQLWSDANQWEYLAVEFYRRGYVLNALLCFRNVDELRGSSFVYISEAEAIQP